MSAGASGNKLGGTVTSSYHDMSIDSFRYQSASIDRAWLSVLPAYRKQSRLFVAYALATHLRH